MEVVLVTWTIRGDAIGQFLADVPSLPAETPGLIREDLYRLVEEQEDVAHFVRIGRWESREQFYEALDAAGAAPFKRPARKPYEAADRSREWLEWIRDDTVSDGQR